MKRYALHILTTLALALALVLAVLWFHADGSVRNSTWVPPEPLRVDYQAMLPVLPPVGSADTSRFVAMLDRPVFSVTRRPPPPPPPPESVQAPPPDNLSTARLSGVFQGNGAGGVIILIAGKQRRAQINDLVDGWTLKSIQGQSVTFMRGAEQRVLTLQRSLLQSATGESAAGAVPQAGSQGAGGVVRGSPGSAFVVPAVRYEPAAETPATQAAQPPGSNRPGGPGAAAGGAAPAPLQPTFGGRS
ncbi:hypothetical protein [Acidovorax sp. FG27]|uniref:hypothetical protein n=1 Tax=Acidovorax sp. FG27 TaxID=3133652 RepID=UPI0030E880D1